MDPSNAMYQPDAGSMTVQCRRRWANVNPALGECFMFVPEAEHGKPFAE